MKLTDQDKKLIDSIVTKTYGREGLEVISYEDFYDLISSDEIEVVKNVLTIDPTDYGFRGRFLGASDVAKDLVFIDGQKFIRNGIKETLTRQYVSRKLSENYKKLNDAIVEDLGKCLLIESSYRSAACQLVNVLYYLKLKEFDLAKTLRRVAMPGYSEHNNLESLAVDFIRLDGIPNDEEPLRFSETEEYEWLLNRAGEFNFYLSYPKDNKYGIMFEPWHWRFQKINDDS